MDRRTSGFPSIRRSEELNRYDWEPVVSAAEFCGLSGYRALLPAAPTDLGSPPTPRKVRFSNTSDTPARMAYRGCERCLVELADDRLRRATRQETANQFKIRKPTLARFGKAAYALVHGHVISSSCHSFRRRD